MRRVFVPLPTSAARHPYSVPEAEVGSKAHCRDFNLPSAHSVVRPQRSFPRPAHILIAPTRVAAVKTGRRSDFATHSDIARPRLEGRCARRHAGAVRGEAAYRPTQTINCLGRPSIKKRDRAYLHFQKRHDRRRTR